MRYRIITNFSLYYKNTDSSILIIIKILRFKVVNVKISHSNHRILTKRNISKTELTQNTLIQQYSTLAPKQEHPRPPIDQTTGDFRARWKSGETLVSHRRI